MLPLAWPAFGIAVSSGGGTPVVQLGSPDQPRSGFGRHAAAAGALSGILEVVPALTLKQGSAVKPALTLLGGGRIVVCESKGEVSSMAVEGAGTRLSLFDPTLGRPISKVLYWYARGTRSSAYVARSRQRPTDRVLHLCITPSSSCQDADVLAQEAAGALAERAAAARGGAGGGAARGGQRCDEATLVVLDCSRSMAQAAFSDLPEAQRCMTAADLQVGGLLSSLDSRHHVPGDTCASP